MAEYTGISIDFAARDDLRRFQATATGALGRRLNMSDALRLAVHLAQTHTTDIPAAAAALGLTTPPARS